MKIPREVDFVLE